MEEDAAAAAESTTSTDPHSWDTDAVLLWLSGIVSLSQSVVDNIREHDVRGADLLLLQREDLRDLGVTRIPDLRRILVAIDAMKDSSVHHPSDEMPSVRSAVEDCPGLKDLLGADLVKELDSPLESDAAYWRRVDLMFALRMAAIRTTEALAESVCLSKSRTVGDLESTDKARELTERKSMVQNILSKVESSIAEIHRRGTSESCPIFVDTMKAYGCANTEIDVVQFVATVKITRSAFLRSLLPSEQSTPLVEVCSGALIQYVCGLSQLQISRLTEDSHPLVKDRILAVQEPELIGTGFEFSVPDEVCRAFLGETLDTEDRLKLSGTRLLAVVETTTGGLVGGEDFARESEEAVEEGSREKTSAARTIKNMLGALRLGGSVEQDELLPDAEDSSWIAGIGESLPDGDREKSGIESASANTSVKEENSDEGADVKSSRRTSLSQPLSVIDKDPRPYTCELDYLSDQFSMVMQQIQIANQRHEKDLKEASVETQPRWMRSNEGKKSSIGELNAKLKLSQRKIELSLELTRSEGNFYPRLEELGLQLQLSSFEKAVLIYLSGSMISPLFKSSISNDSYRGSGRKCTVGDLLLVFCESVSDQVAARKYFYRTAKLMNKGLIRLCDAYGASDLTDQEVLLDRRVLDCIVGLDKESTEIAQGSYLYDPNVDIDSVVLAPGLKESILSTILNFDRFVIYRKQSRFDEAIAYGVGLTLMFCGLSGTGKTMMANAIAAKVGKKLLLVDFPLLAEGGKESSSYQSIFREAELSNAILFFDECESLFAKRESGGVNKVTELLTQLEKFEGICLLATNRPFDLDEAMYRRINEVFEFKTPNHLERREIWRLVTEHKAIPCDESIDWDGISLKYELTGGFIKNAVIAALLAAVGRDSASPKILQSDIIEGCKKQMRGALQMQDFDERVIPSKGLDNLIVSEDVKEHLKQIVDIEKARGILFGMWGFDDAMRGRQGTTALFWGPKGSGKNLAAEAIGFELGKPLKVIDFPQLLGRTGKANATAVQDCFKEARLMDAVLVLGGLSVHSDGRGSAPTVEDTRLLNLVVREMTRFPGIVIMIIDTVDSLDLFVARLEKGLLDGLKFSVQFDYPNLVCREQLWRKLLPQSLPSKGINFNSLAKSSENLNCVQIGNAVYRAAACAALRPKENQCVKMSDLKAAIDDERRRGESPADRWAKSQYL